MTPDFMNNISNINAVSDHNSMTDILMDKKVINLFLGKDNFMIVVLMDRGYNGMVFWKS